MNLSVKERTQFKKAAHALKPVVLLGQNGLTESVLNEIDNALQTHELIKIKIGGVERDTREEISQQICERLDASFVNIIGHVLIIYRKKKES